MAQIEAGADAVTLPDHATGDLVSAEYYRRYLQDLHIEFAERDRRPDHPPHLRAHRRPHGLHRARPGMAAFHYDSKNEPGGVDGGRRRPHQPRRQRQQPRDALSRRAPPRCRRARSARTSTPASRWSGPECAIPLQTPIENLLRDPRRGGVTRQLSTEGEPMAELSDVAQRLHPARRSRSSSSAPDERDRIIDLFARARDRLQDIAAALIDGDDDDGRRADPAGARRRASRRSR